MLNNQKKCIICNENKELFCFHKHKSYYSSYCKICANAKRKDDRRTKEGVIKKIYDTQVNSSKTRNHCLPSYSKQELINWVLDKDIFHILYKNWVVNNYSKPFAPSIDRLDDNRGYHFDNIQLMTWIENNEKAHSDMRNCKIIVSSKPQKPVLKYDKDFNFICEYPSLMSAQRETGVYNENISKVCLGKRKHAGGFIWRHKG